MTLRFFTIALGIVLAMRVSPAATEAFPVDEGAIVAEMEALIDSSPPLDDDARKAVQELLRKGIKAHDAKRFDEAIGSYRQALTIDPLSATVYYELALSYNADGDQMAALDAIIRARTIDPKKEAVYVLEASILDDLGYRDRAEKAYRELLAAQPESYTGHLNLGVTLHRSNRLDEAEAALLRAAEIEPEEASAYFHLALLSKTRNYDYDEARYLEKFIALGGQDSRLEVATARLQDLRRRDVEVEADHPFPAVDRTEKLARAAWRTELHKKAFPETRGYALTFEEDRDVYAKVLAAWRETRTADPAASHGPYDLLLRIDDAGFLNEYIWYHRQLVFGERATTWISDHADRMKAFLDWARAEGLLAADNPASSVASPLDELRARPAELMELITDSPRTYEIGGEASDPTALLDRERIRFSRTLPLRGGNRVNCRKAIRELEDSILDVGVSALVPALRCFRPGDEAYTVATRRATRLSIEPVEIDFRPVGEIRAGNPVYVDVTDTSWLFYAMAKAAWRHEPALRERYGVANDGTQACLEEEIFAVGTLAGAYANGLEPSESDPVSALPARLPELDRLLEAARAGNLRGYVLYEVIHKAYGLPLDRLDEGGAIALAKYVLGHVLRVRRTE